MIEDLKNLNEDELEVLYNTPVWVTLLIAGADSKIDKKEISEAISVTKLKKNRARKDLVEYYNVVNKNFEANLKGHIVLLPKEPEKMSKIVIGNLEKLNQILPKINKSFAIQFYASIKDLARKVAHASGGIMGFLSVGYEESKLIDLNMIKDPSKS